MTRKAPLIALIGLLLMIWVSACELTGGTAPTAINADSAVSTAGSTEQAAAYTEAAKTVMAHNTQAPSGTQSEIPSTEEGSDGIESGEMEKTRPPVITATPRPTKEITEPPSTTPLPQATDTPADTPTSTPRPTKTPVPTSTFSATDIRSRLGEPSIRVTFDDSGPNWYTYEDERVSFQAEDGQLNMTAFEPNFELGWVLAPVEVDAKFYIEMDATPKICAGLDRYGFIISPTRKANRGYMFDFSCDGKYSLWVWDGVAEEVTSLISWTKSDLIRPGSNRTNRIGMLIDINKMYLYANGSLMDQISNDRYDKIYFGLIVGGKRTKNFTVVSEEVNYWTLK